MSTGLVIFSRLDSQRLPGKALKRFAGKPLLGHVIDRAAAATTWDRVVVATSDRPTDDPIAQFVEAEGIELFRGPAKDVLGRALACARALDLSLMGRICGDSPFIDPGLLDRMLDAHRQAAADVTTNIYPRTYPMGMSFEIISRDSLERLVGLAKAPDDREHMTGWIYRNPQVFTIHNVESSLEAWNEWPLTVDHIDDLVQANWILGQLKETAETMTLDSLLALAKKFRQVKPVSDRQRVL